MDNASKALIMAGAILIAVAIVGIGIYIFSSANSMTDDALNQIDALTVTSVNSQLQQYEGNIRGRELKQLINTARSINAQNALPTEIKYKSGESTDSDDTIGGNLPTNMSSFKDNQTFTVRFFYSDQGYIDLITAK